MWAMRSLTLAKDAPVSDFEVRIENQIVEINVLVTLEPPIAPRLVGGEIVEHDMDLAFRICGDDPVHEIEEFDAPASLVVAAQDLAAADVEGGEQRGR